MGLEERKKNGILYVVATPIGNLGDITLRALQVLREVSLIAAEDTRHTRKLLAHYEIKKELLSYFEHNRLKRGPQVLALLQAGRDIALVTNAGTPCISDPGFHLVTLAVMKGIPVVPVPGPSALLTALSVAGLDPQPFLFIGFLPRRKSQRP